MNYNIWTLCVLILSSSDPRYCNHFSCDMFPVPSAPNTYGKYCFCIKMVKRLTTSNNSLKNCRNWDQRSWFLRFFAPYVLYIVAMVKVRWQIIIKCHFFNTFCRNKACRMIQLHLDSQNVIELRRTDIFSKKFKNTLEIVYSTHWYIPFYSKHFELTEDV